MELWIRSQNMQLIRKANYEMCYNERNGHNYIVIDGDVLGSYKTKERAIEVLDEIENILKPQEYEIPTTLNTFIFSTNISNYVYQMPKE